MGVFRPVDSGRHVDVLGDSQSITREYSREETSSSRCGGCQGDRDIKQVKTYTDKDRGRTEHVYGMVWVVWAYGGETRESILPPSIPKPSTPLTRSVRIPSYNLLRERREIPVPVYFLVEIRFCRCCVTSALPSPTQERGGKKKPTCKNSDRIPRHTARLALPAAANEMRDRLESTLGDHLQRFAGLERQAVSRNADLYDAAAAVLDVESCVWVRRGAELREIHAVFRNFQDL